MDTGERIDASTVGGNVPVHIKQSILDTLLAGYAPGARRFESDVLSRIVWTEFAVVPKEKGSERQEARVVAEITVQEDMLNGMGTLHGACSALLIDNCSTMPIALLSLVNTGRPNAGVSQSLNVLFHAPAMMNDKLRIVSTTIALGSRTLTARAEIQNVTRHHRLVASGVHTKMSASDPNPSSKL